MFRVRLVTALVACSFAAGFAPVPPAAASAAATPIPIPSPPAPASPVPAPTLPPSPAPEPSVSADPSASGSPRPIGTFAIPAAGAPPAQAYATFVRGATHARGVIDLIRKDDDVLLDLRPQNFGPTYVVLPSIASGVGGGAFAGRVYPPMPVTFKRVGRRVLWITPNTRYVAARGSSAAASLAISVADGVVYSSPIVAEDPEKTHVVIAPTLLLTDLEGIGTELGRAGPSPLGGLLLFAARPSYGIDSSKTYWLASKAFPTNDELSVNKTFTGPQNALPSVSDGRGIPIAVHYSIVAPPTDDRSYVPRFADDRVGYFITARKRYGDDARSSPFERFIERWDLDNGPIVFTLTDEIPKEYRDTVRRGILAWNGAFAAIGRPDAIRVVDPPRDAAFDPEDVRYNPVRWITADATDFIAYSPHVSDPDTGRIIRAEVVIDGESLRTIKRGYVDRVLAVRRPAGTAALAAPASLLAAPFDAPLDEATDPDVCRYAEDGLSQSALGASMLAANPRTGAADRERYAQAWLYSTVLHEVGHTLGLRHNFRGSTAFTYAQLHDPAFTAAHGTTGSVMDYTPVNLAAPGERQAAYFPDRLGPYDRWAIAYGYTRVPGASSPAAESATLERIARRSREPGLAYGTDEDALDPLALDPRIQHWDLSNDPLAYAGAQFAIDRRLERTLDRRYPGDTRTYEDLRGALISVLNGELAAADIAAHYVGGIFTSRDHRGGGGAPPFAPVPRAEQRRAFALLQRYVLAGSALRFPPALLNDVAPGRFGPHWGAGGVRRPDFPVREVVAELQDRTVGALFAPPVVARIADEELKAGRPGETMSLADLFRWSYDAVYDDLGSASATVAHRELQRRFADLQSQYALLPSVGLDALGIPRQAQALARYHLRGLDARIAAALARSHDEAARASLEDLHDRIRATLEARSIRPT